MNASAIRVQPLDAPLGAVIEGLDLTQPLRGQDIAALRRAWLDHGVVFLRGQALSAQQFLLFAQAIGEPVEYPFVKGIAGFPFIIEVKKLEHERVNFGGIWHSDTTYLERPPMGTMLLAREVPPRGGDTLFASQTLAYEALPEDVKRQLDGLRAVASSSKADVSKTREDRIAEDGRASSQREYCAEHPVLRVHPETGRRALFVNIAHTQRLVGMSEQDSEATLRFLFEHQTKAEFTCRWQWEVGSIALWDNRCTQHFPINDYRGFKRVMHRITLAGDVPKA